MRHKTTLSMTLVLAGIVAFSSASLGEVISSSPSETVRGQIMKVDGQTYVVQDFPAGRSSYTLTVTR